MDFRVFVIIEIPIINKKYEMFVPIDRRIYELIKILKSYVSDMNEGYYEYNEPSLYNKTNGKLYDMNEIIKDSDIKMGTRLVLI